MLYKVGSSDDGDAIQRQGSISSMRSVLYGETKEGLPPRKGRNGSVNSVSRQNSVQDTRAASKSSPNLNVLTWNSARAAEARARTLSDAAHFQDADSPPPTSSSSAIHNEYHASADIDARDRPFYAPPLIHRSDSGIAPSFATAPETCLSSVPETPYEESRGSALDHDPAFPAIWVHYDEDDDGFFDDIAGSTANKRSSARHSRTLRHIRSLSPSKMKRKTSFKGIGAALPAVSTDDIDLSDLASNKVSFSTRGSLMFGGRKMQELIAAKGREGSNPKNTATTTPVPGQATKEYPKAEPLPPPPAPPVIRPPSPMDDDVERDPPRTASTTESGVRGHSRDGLAQTPITEPATPSTPSSPGQGLKTGRRKPSMKMLQAAIQGGRVLSAEELSLSLNVRNMYEHGTENAASFANGIQAMDQVVSGKTTPADTLRDTPTPDTGIGGLSIHKNRDRPNTAQSSHPDNRVSYYEKESHELAGGIEDWQDVNGQYVDRYGFIHPDRTMSHSSASSSQHGRGMQRVATSLRVESGQTRGPRKPARAASSTRSARSVPPRDSKEWTFKKKGPGSIHSTVSQTSRTTNPFRSRTKRALAEASDMLTLPPGLADIGEDEDAGKTASSLKQREWVREDKWQKMARLVRRKGEAKGGGMLFDFDTTDPKLVERTWKGIPDRWRATAWHSFLAASARKRKIGVSDEELIGQFHKLQEMSSADDLQIDVDVPRTVNMHIMFRRRYRGGQRLLFRVLHAVSLYFPDTGYVQGMASLAATLLCYYDEENAFVMMVRLWQLRGLEQLFQNGFEGLLKCLSDFETHWLRGGDVAAKLTEVGIDSTAYGTRWYLTLFNMSMPFPAQLRVWDVFMLLGDAPLSAGQGSFAGADLDVLHATSAALVDATREIILDSDFENAMKVLTSFVPIKDEDLLMRVARAEWRMKKKLIG